MKRDENGRVIRDSEFYSEIAKKVKNPYRPMKDPAYAKKLSDLAAIARAAKRTANSGLPSKLGE